MAHTFSKSRRVASRSPCLISHCSHTFHKSSLLGCDDSSESNIVRPESIQAQFCVHQASIRVAAHKCPSQSTSCPPRSGAPCLNSNCANLERIPMCLRLGVLASASSNTLRAPATQQLSVLKSQSRVSNIDGISRLFIGSQSHNHLALACS